MKSGILNIDKPAGLTSHDVTHAIAKKFSIRAGHSGTLDKFATGLLIVCIEKATKASEYLTGLSKEYSAVALLGKTTDTYDIEGKEISSSTKVPAPGEVEAAAVRFTGGIEQIPPPYSAKKVHGRRASDYARKGIEVQIKPSKVTIHKLKIVRYAYPELELLVSCSSGTYIRSLIKDIGDELGCGAFTRYLRRTKVGDFSIDDSIKFEAVMESSSSGLGEHIIPLAHALSFLPAVSLSPENARLFQNGQKVKSTGLGEKLRVFEENGRLLGIGKASKGFIAPEKVFER